MIGAFKTTPTTSPLVEAGLPPFHILFKHARLRYALRIACASPTTNPAAAALPPCFPSTTSWRDPYTGRHAVPYPMTREWNSTRTWGRPPLHIDALASLLMPGLPTPFQCVTSLDSPAHSAYHRSQPRPTSTQTRSSPSPPQAQITGMTSSSSPMARSPEGGWEPPLSTYTRQQVLLSDPTSFPFLATCPYSMRNCTLLAAHSSMRPAARPPPR